MKNEMKILVSGMLAGTPCNGGATWAVLQYVLGFRRLGHEVVVVEPISREAVDPAGPPLSASRNVAYLSGICDEFQLTQTIALVEPDSGTTFGLTYEDLEHFAASADVLLNISGLLRDDRLKAPPPVRVYLDLDPAFTQLWAAQGVDVGLAGHTHYVTVGQALGRTAAVPTLGLSWLTSVPPVVLDEWPPAEAIVQPALTTVANWRSYGSIHADGMHYGQKAHSVRALRTLPQAARRPVVLALAIHPDEQADLDDLADSGWRLVDPREVAGTPAAYRAFIQGSWAELGVAKSGYVVSRSGWFSDRSACYLASGRPVVAQETGFSDFLPTGEGLLSFETVQDAVEAIRAVELDYDRHAQAARELAVAYFDSDRVLTELLEAVAA